ncbi:MAG: hypothetical protein E7529_05670 [Ruminococcaceae bacterium]|nr:hypothetical protein [Oscillospiraceae bacterium]
MKDFNLFLNIQLFADGADGESGTEECGMQSAECGMSEKGKSDVLDKKEEKSEMNEEVESDVLEDEASDEEKDVIEEDTEDETDAEDENFIREREERLRNRISGWLKESGEIKELYPDFDLRNELRSSRLFSQLILAGAPLKASYEIVHKDEIISGAMAYTADKVREQVVKNIETKGRRPLENGISSESAVMTAIDVNALTPKDIHRILKQVENGASIKF